MQAAKDWLALRRAKRLPLTLTAWDGVKREAEKLSMTLDAAITTAVENGWAGFQSSWMPRAMGGRGGLTKSKSAHDLSDLNYANDTGVTADGRIL